MPSNDNNQIRLHGDCSNYTEHKTKQIDVVMDVIKTFLIGKLRNSFQHFMEMRVQEYWLLILFVKGHMPILLHAGN